MDALNPWPGANSTLARPVASLRPTLSATLPNISLLNTLIRKRVKRIFSSIAVKTLKQCYTTH